MRFAIRLALATFATAGTLGAQAQQLAPIERVKITDGQMTCAQMLAETGEMDKAVAAAQAAQSSGETTAMAGTAANAAAEVASRTGLFGQIGGLAGALFGKAAAQGAAGIAQQSGQMSAQQAAERSKQALARKEYLAGLFNARGCRASDPSFEPPPAPPAGGAPAGAAPNPAATGASAQAAFVQASLAAPGAAPAPALADPAALQKLFAPANITALPDADPDKHFKGAMGGTFGKNVIEVMPNSKRVAVAGFRVVFITENVATAVVRSSYFLGRDTSGARSTTQVNLEGVDQTTMQAITDKAYADFLAQLKLAGREVVPLDEMKEFHAGVSSPGRSYAASGNGQKALVLAPASLPLYFTAHDGQWGNGGPFDQKNIRSMAELAAKTKAIVIAPLVVVNFARMTSTGNQSGMIARSAETGASLAMHVPQFITSWQRSDETRMGLVMNGDDGGIQMIAAINSDAQFGSLAEADHTDNKEIKSAFDSLGKAMGMANAGGAATSKTDYATRTSPQAYASAALDALGRATGTFAKWFQKYPAK